MLAPDNLAQPTSQSLLHGVHVHSNSPLLSSLALSICSAMFSSPSNPTLVPFPPGKTWLLSLIPISSVPHPQSLFSPPIDQVSLPWVPWRMFFSINLCDICLIPLSLPQTPTEHMLFEASDMSYSSSDPCIAPGTEPGMEQPLTVMFKFSCWLFSICSNVLNATISHLFQLCACCTPQPACLPTTSFPDPQCSLCTYRRTYSRCIPGAQC